MHRTVFSGAIHGVNGLIVEVEVDISRGIPAFTIVGLPNAEVRESRERVAAAVKNSEWDFPLQRITVNLAPADVKKEGAAFDLAIAVGILAASGQIDIPLENQGESTSPARQKIIVLGELALSGALRRIRGVLPVLLSAVKLGFSTAVIPAENFNESLMVEGLEVYGCKSLREAVAVSVIASPDCSILTEGILHKRSEEVDNRRDAGRMAEEEPDMSEVLGQESVKRALLVAAAGRHHVLMVGPPGAGKTMLAKRLPSLLPPLSREAALETTMIYSIMGLLNGRCLLRRPPFRSPHHSASDAGLIGGGGIPKPGEVTMAHNGVLFLDELPEFKRHVLETLREPIEAGSITIARARHAVTFPANFQLIAAMNPCPCGYLGSRVQKCRCTPMQVEKYLGKISGPLLDRISIHCFVNPVEISAFMARNRYSPMESSGCLRGQVEEARSVQEDRYRPCKSGFCNATAPRKVFQKVCKMEDSAEELLLKAQKQLNISARGRDHIIRVSRTIADLEKSDKIAAHHVAEAVQYRIKELPE